MHIVHLSKTGKYAVIAFLFEAVDQDNFQLEGILKAVGKAKNFNGKVSFFYKLYNVLITVYTIQQIILSGRHHSIHFYPK
jgi:carbonic anhydrase